jgi:glycosyl transferase, family 25
VGLIDLFDRIFIVNLQSRADRRREMREMLSRVGWDPDAPKVTWYPAMDPRTTGGFQSPGERGCFLSHLGALNLARNAGYRRILVFEDDCEFVPDFFDRQAACAGWLESTAWDMAYLGHNEAISGPAGPARWDPDAGIALAHCYVVTGDVLSRLPGYLERMMLRPPGSPNGGPMALDGAYNWFRRENPDLVTMLASPSLAFQRSSRSDLSPKWFDQVPVLSALASKARVLRRSSAGSL